jgi:hypothetical protein
VALHSRVGAATHPKLKLNPNLHNEPSNLGFLPPSSYTTSTIYLLLFEPLSGNTARKLTPTRTHRIYGQSIKVNFLPPLLLGTLGEKDIPGMKLPYSHPFGFLVHVQADPEPFVGQLRVM